MNEIICELSPDEGRRAFARTLLAKLPYVGDIEGATAEFVRARKLLLGMRDIEAWASLLAQNRAFARLLDVQGAIAAQLLHAAARRAMAANAPVDRAFRAELGKALPSRPGPKRDRLPDYLADRVVLAYHWLTGGSLPAGDPYDAARPVAGSALYRLGAAAFRAHGVRWHASRLKKAIDRDTHGLGLRSGPIDGK